MSDFLALLATTPGQVVLTAFARRAGMTEAEMRYELGRNPPLARYFLTVIATAMREVPA